MATTTQPSLERFDRHVGADAAMHAKCIDDAPLRRVHADRCGSVDHEGHASERETRRMKPVPMHGTHYLWRARTARQRNIERDRNRIRQAVARERARQTYRGVR